MTTEEVEEELTPEASAESVSVRTSLEPPIQSRFSIVLRPILLIPFAVVLVFYEFLAAIVTIGAWCVMLVTGRMPDGFRDFTTGYVRYYANYTAYASLLTRKLPGLSIGPKTGDRVHVDIDVRPVNRVSVLFRVVLALPAAMLFGVLGIGLELLFVIAWIVGIFTAQLPRSLHQALAAIMRYQIRAIAYLTLLTPEQPFRGLFGDDLESNDSSTEDAVTDSVTDDDGQALGTSSSNWDVRGLRWSITTAARRIIAVTIVIAFFLSVFLGIVTTAKAAKHVQDAHYTSITETSFDNTLRDVRSYSSTLLKCTTVICGGDAALVAADGVHAEWLHFISSGTFPPRTKSAYLAYLSAFSTLELRIRAVANAKTTAEQRNMTYSGSSSVAMGLSALQHQGYLLLRSINGWK